MKTLTLIIAFGFFRTGAISQNTIDSSDSIVVSEILEELEPSKQLTDSILNDLVKLKIIKDQNNVAFSLNYDKFEVNNKKQPTEILEVFKKKYHITKGYSVSYAKTKGSTSTSIIKKD
ncbi:MAG: hypothetical protein V4506_12165 [Bacteroidota bacterium]